MEELENKLKVLLDAHCMLVEQYNADMEAIRHELEAVWEAINELQGIDPAKAGEPEELTVK